MDHSCCILEDDDFRLDDFGVAIVPRTQANPQVEPQELQIAAAKASTS